MRLAKNMSRDQARLGEVQSNNKSVKFNIVVEPKDLNYRL